MVSWHQWWRVRGVLVQAHHLPLFSGDSDDLFSPMAGDDAVDDEETIDTEELIAEKVWLAIMFSMAGL